MGQNFGTTAAQLGGNAVGLLGLLESVKHGGILNALAQRQALQQSPEYRASLIGSPFAAGLNFIGGANQQPVSPLPDGSVGPPQPAGNPVFIPQFGGPLTPKAELSEILPQLQAALVGGQVTNQPIAQQNANDLAQARLHFLRSQSGLNERALELAGMGSGQPQPAPPSGPATSALSSSPMPAQEPAPAGAGALPPPPQPMKQSGGVNIPKLQLKGMGISGGNASMQFGVPTAKTVKVNPGTMNPATGKPYVTGEETPDSTPNQRVTAMVNERKPTAREVERASNTRTLFDTVKDVQEQFDNPDNAETLKKLGPSFAVTLPSVGMTVGPKTNVLQHNYEMGGMGLAPNEQKLAASLSYLNSTGYQTLLASGRGSEKVIDDIKQHLPSLEKTESQNRENLHYIVEKYKDVLGQIPESAGGEKAPAGAAPAPQAKSSTGPTTQESVDFFNNYPGKANAQRP